MPKDYYAEEIDVKPTKDFFAEEVAGGVAKQFGLEALKSLAIPGFAGPISKRVIERPQESLQATLGAYGIAKYPASLGLSALTRFGLDQPKAEEFIERGQQEIAKQPFIRGGIPQIATGLAGEVARRTTPEQFIGTTKGLAQAGVFMGSAALKLDPLLKDLSGKASSRLLRTLPKIHGKNYLVNRASQTGEGIERIYESFEPKYDALYGRIGNKIVNKAKVQEIANDLPTNIINKIRKSNRIILQRDGSTIPDINNLREVKSILQTSLPKGVRNEVLQATPEQGQIKFALTKIRELMAEGNPELVGLNAKYGEFMRLKGKVSGIIFDKFGKPKSLGLASLYKKGAERGKQIAFEDLSKLYPQAKQIIKDVSKFATRQAAKELSKKVFGTIARFGLFYPLIRGVMGGFGQ